MNKETVKRKYDRHFGIEPNDDEFDFYFDIIDSAKEECALSDDDLDTVEELRDLMEDTVEGNYKPDSFTTQPINTFITKQKAIRDSKE